MSDKDPAPEPVKSPPPPEPAPAAPPPEPPPPDMQLVDTEAYRGLSEAQLRRLGVDVKRR